MGNIWKEKVNVATLAISTKSFQQTISKIRRIKGFGGTGFRAKEIMLDVKSILDKSNFEHYFEDYEDWTPVGPGARKALCRIFSSVHIKKNSEQDYFRMLNIVHSFLLNHDHVIPKNMIYTIHDTQFVLCEFEKYMRLLNHERGFCRKY